VRAFAAAVCLGLTLVVTDAHAIGDDVRFAQASTGVVSAILEGTIDPCKGSHYFPMGVPMVALVGHEYDLTQPFAIIDPPPCPDTPSNYQVTASLGTVADGHYSVVWTVGTVVATATFDVRSGVLLAVSPVPTLSLPLLAAMASLIALTAVLLLRRLKARPSRVD
jgi:hypothetical protein